MENTERTWAKIPLFDDYWVDFKKNVIRRWYTPTKIAENTDPAIGGCYLSAMWSPENNCYLMWNEHLVDPLDDEYRYMRIARSDDGIHWESMKVREDFDPEKKIYENTVYLGNPGLHGCCVYRDPYDPDPNRRYKMAGANRAMNYPELGVENSPVCLSVSPDGIHWQEAEQPIIHPNTSDTYNCIYYNPVTKEYNTIIRASYVERRICQTTSKDLVHWSHPKCIFHPGADFNDDAYATQLYGLCVQWMGCYYVGFLWRYHTSCGDFDYSRMRGFQDCELLYSYDGEHWMRSSGQAIVERPCYPELGASSLLFSTMFDNADGTKHYLMANGSCTMHAALKEHAAQRAFNRPTGGILTYEIRKDGFCGLEANTKDGLVVTKSFQLLEPELYANINATFGEARFAILNHDGTPYEGFDFDDCIPLLDDDVRYKITFKEHSLEELVGKRFRLAVELAGAVLHCFEGAMRPWIRFPQKSMNDPVHTTYVDQK